MTSSPPKENATDSITRMELTLSVLLRTGMLVSLSIVLLGIMVMFIHHPEYTQSQDTLNYLKSGDYAFPSSLDALAQGVLRGEGRSIVLLGVFVLFMTPLLRVAASVITFAASGDWPFTIITLIVLCIVILSLVLGRTG